MHPRGRHPRRLANSPYPLLLTHFLTLMSESGAGDDALDLHDLAVLLTYERFTLEPSYRHTKLVDMALAAADFQTVRPEIPEWTDPTPACRAARWGYFFKAYTPASAEDGVRDLPSTMLPDPCPGFLLDFLEHARERETAFYQARALRTAHESVALLRCVLELLGAEARPLRIRTAAGATALGGGAMRAHTYALDGLRAFVLSLIAPPQARTMEIRALGKAGAVAHDVAVFDAPGVGPVVLDLSCVQFGALSGPGRGRALFALEPQDAYEARLRTVAESVQADTTGITEELEVRHEWLREVAARVKARYDRRATAKWCGHCGAPGPVSACGRCGTERYCSRDHQLAAWPMHKLFCVSRAGREAKAKD